MTALDLLMPIERAAVVATSVLCDADAEELAAAVRSRQPLARLPLGWEFFGHVPNGGAVYTRPVVLSTSPGWFQ